MTCSENWSGWWSGLKKSCVALAAAKVHRPGLEPGISLCGEDGAMSAVMLRVVTNSNQFVKHKFVRRDIFW